MKLFKVNNFMGTTVATRLFDWCMNATKFEIDVDEVFGQDWNPTSLDSWLKDKPEDIYDWLNLPFGEAYFEMHNLRDWALPNSNHELPLSLYVTNTNGILEISVIKIISNTFIMQEQSVMLNLNGPFRKDTFENNSSYKQWYNAEWNKSKRVIISSWDWQSKSLIGVTHSDFATFDVSVLMEILLYLNANGIGTTINTAPKKKHTVRKWKKAYNDWTYKTLRIIKKGESKEIINNNKRVRVPFITRKRREHTVRGHIRVHSTAGPIWISPHVRCKGTEGKVVKDYVVN